MYKVYHLDLIQSKDLWGQLKTSKGIFFSEDSLHSIPGSFPFSENSNYGRESLLQVYRQNIAGCCQQTIENKMPSNVLPLHLKQISTEGEGDGIKSKLLFKTFPTLQLKYF